MNLRSSTIVLYVLLLRQRKTASAWLDPLAGVEPTRREAETIDRKW